MKNLALFISSIVFCMLLAEIICTMAAETLGINKKPDMGPGMRPHPVLHHSWPANVKYIADPRFDSYPFITNKQRWMENYDIELTKK